MLLADLSVTGAALLGPADSPLAAVVPGADLALTVADHSGTVRVRHAGRRGDWFQLGVEFTDLSPGLEELIYDAVERIRDGRGDLVTAWTTAR